MRKIDADAITEIIIDLAVKEEARAANAAAMGMEVAAEKYTRGLHMLLKVKQAITEAPTLD